MRRFVISAALACVALSPLSATMRPFFSMAVGPAGENVGKEQELFTYDIMAKINDEVQQDTEQAGLHRLEPGYQDYLVTVSSRDKMGCRMNGVIGVVFNDVYKVDAEFSACVDRTLIKHTCPDLQKSESHSVKRSTMSGMINVGGYFPGKWSLRPYSMVGMGMQRLKESEFKHCRFAYQWLTGVESPIVSGVSSYVHHRYRKSLRGNSMHSAEFGIKFSV